MNLTKISTVIATLGPVGYFGASGTVATFLTLPLVYLSRNFIMTQWIYACMLVVAAAAALFVIRIALFSHFKRQDDPSEIVLDEVIGCLITFWAIPLTVQSVLVGFLLFRAFDIIKFGLVKKAEEWAGAWGVLGDDVVAALIANSILRLLFYGLILHV